MQLVWHIQKYIFFFKIIYPNKHKISVLSDGRIGGHFRRNSHGRRLGWRLAGPEWGTSTQSCSRSGGDLYKTLLWTLPGVPAQNSRVTILIHYFYRFKGDSNQSLVWFLNYVDIFSVTSHDLWESYLYIKRVFSLLETEENYFL